MQAFSTWRWDAQEAVPLERRLCWGFVHHVTGEALRAVTLTSDPPVLAVLGEVLSAELGSLRVVYARPSENRLQPCAQTREAPTSRAYDESSHPSPSRPCRSA